MSTLVVSPSAALCGRMRVPGDKSISHRALLLGALAEGPSRVYGFLPSADCRATLHCLRMLGVRIEEADPTTLVVHGRGLLGLSPPPDALDCGSSGTTMRLLSGMVAGQPFRSVLTGSEQLRHRPMTRVTAPLRQMGARVIDTQGHAPLTIEGGQLHGVDYAPPVASAQVKSAILLAGLYADSATTVREPGPSRDHTERMLCAMGADLELDGLSITLRPGRPLQSRHVNVPGDISSAAFLVAAAVMVPGSCVTVENVGVNPTRTGALDALQSMGAEIRVEDRRQCSGEPVSTVTSKASGLRAVKIGGATVPRLIDELPLLALVATQAQGTTVIRDAAELRVKETDRIASTAAELLKMGADIEPRPDGLIVRGPSLLVGTDVESHGDHRLAMTLAVAGLVAEGRTLVHDVDCISDSFPGFADTLRRLGADLAC